MKKIIKYIAIIFFTYLVIMIYLGNTNQYFTYSEMDDDCSGIISLGELLWYGDVGTRIRCDDIGNLLKEKCVLEIFALKE